MNLFERAESIIKFGEAITDFLDKNDSIAEFSQIVSEVEKYNPWFTKESIKYSLFQHTQMLNRTEIDRLIEERGKDMEPLASKTVALIMAGNIPLVGFQDMIHVLLCGHRAMCRLSSEDNKLLPFLAEMLYRINPKFKDKIIFVQGTIADFDAVIATGSNNSSRYFEYYFKDVQHIIRKNRNSVAILTGNETEDQLVGLAHDVFLYFGKGCRNISKLYVPKGYDFIQLMNTFQLYNHYSNHNKYMNNADYYRAIFLVNSTPFVDGGFFSIVQSEQISSPVSVLYYTEYDSVSEVISELSLHKDELQCIVGDHSIGNIDSFGKTQSPKIDDFADGVDTINFLAHI